MVRGPASAPVISAPASAMIPVTYRGLAASFAVFAGHPGDGLREIDWSAASLVETAVFLMGVERLPLIVKRLLETRQKTRYADRRLSKKPFTGTRES